MSAKETKLEPGWLARELDDIAALERAKQKIEAAAHTARINAYTQPMSIEFTIPELRALHYMQRCP